MSVGLSFSLNIRSPPKYLLNLLRRPFIIDLESANGCLVNDTDVPQSRYYEMRNGDTLKLGGSQREYVLLAED